MMMVECAERNNFTCIFYNIFYLCYICVKNKWMKKQIPQWWSEDCVCQNHIPLSVAQSGEDAGLNEKIWVVKSVQTSGCHVSSHPLFLQLNYTRSEKLFRAELRDRRSPALTPRGCKQHWQYYYTGC